MNRNKKHTDWTDALRDRLQDAELPLADGWSVPESPVVPARSGAHWAGWGWALAGAAAVLAAVLLLRPARPAGPEPVHLVEAPAAGTPGTAAPSDQLVAQALDQKAGETPSRNAAAMAGRRPQHSDARGAEPVPSSEKAVFEENAGKKDLPSSERAGIEDEIPGQARNDENVARNDDKNAQNGENVARNDDKNTRSDEITARNGEIISQNGETVAREDKAVVLKDDQEGKAEDEAGKQQGRSLDEMTRGDFAAAGEPEAAGARGPRRPVSLRLQAAGPGVALAAGGKAAFDNAPYSDPGYYNGYSKTYPNGYDQEPQSPAPTQAPFPISVGVSAALPLSRSWTLAAGLDYTQRAAARIATLHYLGLPLDLHYYFNPESRLRVWLGGGLKAEKSIYVTGAEPLRDPVLFSWNFQAGADLRVLPGVRLYVSPALTRYLNHSAYAVSWDEGSSFSLRAGLSFDLK